MSARTPSLFGTAPDHGFESWWELYRSACALHKCSPGPKAKALEKWEKKHYAEQTQDMLRVLAEQIETHRQFLKAKQFIPPFPHAHRYLRDERWKDEQPHLETFKRQPEPSCSSMDRRAELYRQALAEGLPADEGRQGSHDRWRAEQDSAPHR